jgi:integrase
MPAQTDRRTGSITSACSCRNPETGSRYRKGECPKAGKRGHERWYFVIDLDPRWDKDARRWFRQQLKSPGFPTRIQAVQALEAELPKIRNHTAPSLADRQVTVGEYLDRWLRVARDAKGKRWRPATKDTYTKLVESYLRPALGRHPLAELRPAHIRDALDPMTSSGLSPTTVHLAYSALRTALNAAIREQILTWNPCMAAKVEGPARPEMEVWTPGQVATFLAHAEQVEPHLAVAYQLAAWRGLRRGELAGLRWSDADLAAGTLRVQRSVGDSGEVGEPKTSRGKRTVSLGPKLVAALRAHQAAQPVRGLPPQDWVLTGPDGQMLRPWVLTQTFLRLVRELPLPEIHLHSLRHTAATHMLQAGVAPKIVQDQLGHATLAMTMDTYGHVIPAQRDASADAVEALYEQGR